MGGTMINPRASSGVGGYWAAGSKVGSGIPWDREMSLIFPPDSSQFLGAEG